MYSVGGLVIAPANSSRSAGVEVEENSLWRGFTPFAENLRVLLREYLERGVPGLSVAIGSGSGESWLTVAGRDHLENGTPLTLDHVIGAGSITKTFVAVVIMQLVEERRLDLHSPIHHFVEAHILAGVANAEIATVAQLMNHTSGIPSWEDDPAWIRDARGSRVDPKRAWSPTDTLDYVRARPRLFSPGAEYRYSNTNYTLLGLAIERITGATVADEIAQRICRPLGLKRTYLEGFSMPEIVGAIARRYHYKTTSFVQDAGVAPVFPNVGDRRIDVTRSNLSTEWATGGIVTTAGDLLRFAIALRDGKLLTGCSLRYMQVWRPADQNGFVGHGLFRRPVGCYWAVGHTGSVLGATGSFFWIEDHDCVVAILSNVGTMHVGNGRPGAADLGRDPRLLNVAVASFANRLHQKVRH